ncbi:hypothetical protein E4U43_008243 [Claviceps pusilla]|uniref:Uncharacterized protein n=1 Tax=Claviceps pusilla TaxID=123648 RepID=A0A9P7T0V6_9HYPO|nr:hypothetical protein E4U43_008243 [Claviceps pusilla]
MEATSDQTTDSVVATNFQTRSRIGARRTPSWSSSGKWRGTPPGSQLPDWINVSDKPLSGSAQELVPVRRSSCQRCQRRPASINQRVSTNDQRPTKKKKERTHANGLLRGGQVPASNCSKSKIRRDHLDQDHQTHTSSIHRPPSRKRAGLGWAGLAGNGSWRAGLKPDSAASSVVVIRIDPVWSEHRRPPPFSGHVGPAPLSPKSHHNFVCAAGKLDFPSDVPRGAGAV